MRIGFRRVFGKQSKKNKSFTKKLGYLISLKVNRRLDRIIYLEKQRKPVASKQQANNVIAFKRAKAK
jgi:hypothetical protein